MRTLGICTSCDIAEDINYETNALCKEGALLYDDVILIDPQKVAYKFIRGHSKPEVIFAGKDISNLSTLIVRRTMGKENSISLLIHSLSLCGCDVLEPVWRFHPNRISKLLGTVARFKKGVGTTTFLVFDVESALNLLRDLDEEGYFPLLVKPIAGKQGEGITILSDVSEAIKYARAFFDSRIDPDEPLFLQQFVKFKEEYRVFVIYGRVLGVVKKIRGSNKIPANAAQGATFINVNNPIIAEFALQHVNRESILGVDVAIGPDGECHIIESNRAPLWYHFEGVTGINVGKEIVKHAIKRLDKTNS